MLIEEALRRNVPTTGLYHAAVRDGVAVEGGVVVYEDGQWFLKTLAP